MDRYDDKLKQYEKAIADYTKAIEIYPHVAYFYSNRASSYYIMEQYERAIDDYKKAIEIDPKFIDAFMDLSLTWINFNDYDAALKQAIIALEKAKETDDIIICHYLKCISEKLLGKDTTESEKQIDQLIKEDFILNWSFDGIENWLKDADIDKDTREFIIEKTEMLKAKQ